MSEKVKIYVAGWTGETAYREFVHHEGGNGLVVFDLLSMDLQLLLGNFFLKLLDLFGFFAIDFPDDFIFYLFLDTLFHE